jgi:ectoine hydroxylase-related dioxygenase (phytanoyl-CoA dioxygenase family)
MYLDYDTSKSEIGQNASSPGSNGSDLFDKEEYLRSNQDVRRSGIDAMDHWNQYGKDEKRVVSWMDEFLAYLSQGIIVLKNSVPLQVIEAANYKIEEFKTLHQESWSRNSDNSGLIRRVTNLHRYSQSICNLFSHNRAAGLVDYIFNAETCVYTSLYFEAGSEQPIHRDTPYFHTKPVNRFVGCWVALEDATLENGALLAIKGGHLVPELDLTSIAGQLYADLREIDPNDQSLWISYQDKMRDSCLAAGLTVEPIEISAGDTIIWHPMLPHGGSPIINKALSRKSLVFHITPLNTPVYHQDYFFNPLKEMLSDPPWGYQKCGERLVANISSDVVFSGLGVSESIKIDVD